MSDTLETAPGGAKAEPQDGTAIRLYLVDGSGFIFRAFHALPPLTRKSDGVPIGAVSGFCNMIWKLLVDMKTSAEAPTHLAVIFDHSEKTFRNKLYDQYKAHRPPPPEDLVPQFPLVREATLAFGVPAIELPGYEADDLIAAYATKVREMGGEVVIVSSDKDLMQLVGPKVFMFDAMKNVKVGIEQVAEKFGVTPDKVVDVQALCGDSVDNVPGAPGIGIKTASALINEYGDLDTWCNWIATRPFRNRWRLWWSTIRTRRCWRRFWKRWSSARWPAGSATARPGTPGPESPSPPRRRRRQRRPPRRRTGRSISAPMSASRIWRFWTAGSPMPLPQG